jgi:hypothetical protein
MQSPGLAMRTVQDLAQAHAPDLVADVAANYAELRGLARAAAAGGSGYAQLPERLRTDMNALRPRLEERRAALAAAVGDSTAALGAALRAARRTVRGDVRRRRLDARPLHGRERRLAA